MMQFTFVTQYFNFSILYIVAKSSNVDKFWFDHYGPALIGSLILKSFNPQIDFLINYI